MGLHRRLTVPFALSGLFALAAAACSSASGPVHQESRDAGDVAAVLTGDYEVVAEDGDLSGTFAVSGAKLLWVDRGAKVTDSVKVFDLTTHETIELYTASPDATAAIEDLAVNGTDAYVSEFVDGSSGVTGTKGDIKRIPLDGGTPEGLLVSTDLYFDVRLTASRLVFTDYDTVYAIPLPNGTLATLDDGEASESDPFSVGGISDNGASAFWIELGGTTEESGQLRVVGASGSASKLIDVAEHSATGPTAIAAGTSDVFFSALAGGTQTLWQVPIAGGKPEALTTLTGDVDAIATDGVKVYVLEEAANTLTESLVEIPVGGGAKTTRVTGIQPAPKGNPGHSLAFDDAHVYFAVVGKVLRIAK